MPSSTMRTAPMKKDSMKKAPTPRTSVGGEAPAALALYQTVRKEMQKKYPKKSGEALKKIVSAEFEKRKEAAARPSIVKSRNRSMTPGGAKKAAKGRKPSKQVEEEVVTTPVMKKSKTKSKQASIVEESPIESSPEPFPDTPKRKSLFEEFDAEVVKKNCTAKVVAIPALLFVVFAAVCGWYFTYGGGSIDDMQIQVQRCILEATTWCWSMWFYVQTQFESLVQVVADFSESGKSTSAPVVPPVVEVVKETVKKVTVAK